MTIRLSCEEVRMSLGVYVLGALDADEAAEVQAHLDDCPECLAELAELSGLPPMLARVSVDDIDRVARPPQRVLERVLTAAAKRHRRTRWTLGLAASIAVVALGGSLLNGLAGQSTDTDSTAGAVAASARPVAPESYSVMADGSASAAARASEEDQPSAKLAEQPVKSYSERRGEVVLKLELSAEDGGTHVLAHVTGVPVATTCRLYAIGFDGQPSPVSSWKIEAGEYRAGASFQGSTNLAIGEIERFELRNGGNARLIMVPVA